MFLRLLKYGAVTGGAVGAMVGYEAYTLRKKYPWKQGLSPDTKGTLPEGVVNPGHVSAVVRVPPTIARAQPLETYLTTFYNCWTLRLEGWMASKMNLVCVPPPHVPRTADSFANGLFQGVFRDDKDSTLMVAWAAGKPSMVNPPPGGIQVFTARIDDITGELNISFGGAEWEPPYGPPLDGTIGNALHHFYTRYLLDHAKRGLEDMAKKEGTWTKEGK